MGAISACSVPDEYAEHIGDAAHEEEGKHKEGQPFCGASPQVLEDLWNPSCQIGDCHTPTQTLPNVNHLACIAPITALYTDLQPLDTYTSLYLFTNLYRSCHPKKHWSTLSWQRSRLQNESLMTQQLT